MAAGRFPRYSFFSFLLAAVAVLWTAAGQGRAAPPELAPLEAWISRQAGIKSLVAEIRQERHLRTVKKPLVSLGRFWFVRGGAFRWQAGDPPKLVAVMTPQEELSVIYPPKKTAEVFSAEALADGEAGQGIEFLRAGFPSGMEDFLKRFEVLAVRRAGEWDEVEVKPAGTGASFAVRKLVFTIHRAGSRLGAMQIHLRDGSWINNTVTGLQENVTIPSGQFSYDLTGYEVKRK